MSETTWTGRSGGSWFVASNWNAGLPTASTYAYTPEGVTIDFNGKATVYALEMAIYVAPTVLNLAGGQLTMESTSSVGILDQTGGDLDFVAAGNNSWIATLNQKAGTVTIGSGSVYVMNGGSIAGTTSGPGTLVLRSGIFTINSGASIKTSAVTQWAQATIVYDTSFTYGGSFAGADYSQNYLNGNTLTLSGSGTLTGQYNASTGTGDPAGKVLISGSYTIGDLTLAQGLTIEDKKEVIQTDGLFLRGGTAKIDAGAVWNITSDVIENSNGTIVNSGTFEQTGGSYRTLIGDDVVNIGTVEVTASKMEFLAGLNNTGTMIASGGGTLYVNNTPITSSGKIEVQNNGTLEFGNPTAASIKTTFMDSTGHLVLDDPYDFAASIIGFRHGDKIHLNANATSESYSNGILNVSWYGSPVAHLHIAGNFTSSSFHMVHDVPGGTDITV